MQSYIEIQQQIDTLTAEAERIKETERKTATITVQQTIDLYGLTAKEIKLHENGRRKKMIAIKYRNIDGKTWTGRGRAPSWIHEAMNNGNIDQFKVAA